MSNKSEEIERFAINRTSFEQMSDSQKQRYLKNLQMLGESIPHDQIRGAKFQNGDAIE